MTFTESQMREWVTKAYRGRFWPDKVKKMSYAQVLAIFTRLRKSGKIPV